MRIEVEWGISESTGTITVDLEDLNHTEKSWDKLSSEEQHDVLQDYLNEEPNEPYRIVENVN